MWEFIVIVACAVAGFWLVSFIYEALGSRKKPAARPADAPGGEEPTREASWFEVLGVTPSASVNEIKTAYRERAQRYHPDRVEGLGVEIREMAELKMKELNAAYNTALKGR